MPEQVGLVIKYLSLFGAIYSALFCLIGENIKFYNDKIKQIETQKDDVDLKGRKETITSYYNKIQDINSFCIRVKWLAILVFNLLIFAICIYPNCLLRTQPWSVYIIIAVGILTNLWIWWKTWQLKSYIQKIQDEYSAYSKDKQGKNKNQQDAPQITPTDPGNTGESTHKPC